MIKNIPKIYYDLAIRDEIINPIIITDLLVRIKHIVSDLENKHMFFSYMILDGESPEIISHKFYNTMDFHWVIMYINNLFDYISDFPLSYDAMQKFVEQKYGADKINDIHHYIDTYGNITNEYYYDYKNILGTQPDGIDANNPIWKDSIHTVAAIPVTNYEYEDELNERKRHIKLIKPTYINQFTKTYEKALRDST